MHVNYLAVAGATVAAFVFSSVWYVVFGKLRSKLSSVAAAGSRPPIWMIPAELVRTVVLASVLSGLATHLRITDGAGAVQLASALWIGFPFILLSGSVLYENVPWKLAAIHAGDWLGKLLIISIVVSVWR